MSLLARSARHAARATRALVASTLAERSGRNGRAVAYAKVYARHEHVAKTLRDRAERQIRLGLI